MTNKLTDALHVLVLKSLVAAQLFAVKEPVRLRAIVVSVVLAAGVLVPALADEHLARSIAGAAVVAIPLLAGESARKKVSPTD